MRIPEVEAGATLMDVTFPGWENHVDIDYLDMNAAFFDKNDEKPEGCVLCQIDAFIRDGIHGWYARGFHRIFPDHVDDYGPTAEKYAFILPRYSTIDLTYEQLTEAWINEIEKRREAATPQNA